MLVTNFVVFVFEWEMAIAAFIVVFNNIIFAGLFGVLYNQKNFIVLLIAVEVLFFGVGLHFVLLGALFKSYLWQLYALYILAVVGGESAFVLSIVVSIYREGRSIEYEAFTELKG